MGLLKNSTIIVFGIVVSNILAYVFHIYVGRTLGPVDYGIFGALMSLIVILMVPGSAFGMGLAKYVSKFNSNKEYEKIGILKRKANKRILFYVIVIFLLILLGSKFIADFLKIDSIIPIILSGLTFVFGVFLMSNRGILQGMKKFKAFSLNSILESGLRLLIVVVLLIFGFGVNGAVLSFGLGYFIAFLLITPFITETKTTKDDDLKLANIYRFVSYALILHIILKFTTDVPTIFVKHFFSPEFAGLWVSALTLARVTLFITSGIAVVMFAEVAGEKKKKNQKKTFMKSLGLVLLASVCMSLIFWVVGGFFIKLLYGSAFLGAFPILKWMGIAMIGISVLQLSLNYWLAGRG